MVTTSKEKRVQTKKDDNSSWSLIGGEWPTDIEGASGEKRLAYGLLRGAIETLVLRKDGYLRHPDIEGLSITDDYWNARGWIMSDDFETENMEIRGVCKSVGIELEGLRGLIRSAKL
jgi:hypothetical protein